MEAQVVLRQLSVSGQFCDVAGCGVSDLCCRCFPCQFWLLVFLWDALLPVVAGGLQCSRWSGADVAHHALSRLQIFRGAAL